MGIDYAQKYEKYYMDDNLPPSPKLFFRFPSPIGEGVRGTDEARGEGVEVFIREGTQMYTCHAVLLSLRGLG